MHGERVHHRRYYPNRIWLGAYRDSSFDFWSDSEQLDSDAILAIQRGHGPKDKEANPLWIAGTYETTDDKLIQSLGPESGDGYVWVTKYIIMDDRIVGPFDNKNPMTLLFKPAPIDMTFR